MGDITFLIAFGAGVLSFLSPCVLPLVPVYLASLAGPELLAPGLAKNRFPVFLHALSFVIGFTVIFAGLGAIAGVTGFTVGSHLPTLRKIAGGLLIIFGLFMLLSQKFPQLNYEKRLAPSLSTTTGYVRSFLTGGVFTIAWTPCVGPILGGILSLALTSETTWQGSYLLLVYSLGLGLPFLIIGAAFNSVAPLLRRINRYSFIIYIVSGVLLLAVGILILTNNLAWLQVVV